ncbi:hypothetical protein GLX27_000544 [Malassezia furfur]|uniref:Uncharacterized protein n=1 Tax=Malassezia furfur TaxID=55194 RepID=A0ABY8ENG2_MALFU|nr:hypothetical protein GLX27_000544 [Malassezia furfur]
MKSAAYVVRVPHAVGAFAVQCTVLDHSLMVWCGVAPASLGDDSDGEDDEVRAAMQAAGRAEPAIAARLAHDWSVAMNRAGSGNVQATTGSTLYNTQGIALAMAKRIAAKLGIPQVFLSLDLPEAWTSSMPRASEDVRALQLLELGIRRVCEQALSGAT